MALIFFATKETPGGVFRLIKIVLIRVKCQRLVC